MKKLLLVLFICLVIDFGKEIFPAIAKIINKSPEFEVSFEGKGNIHSDKQLVFKILILQDECHCP